jgi:hypothetical protein
VEQLEAASRLVKEPLGFSYGNRTVRFDVDLPPHAVAAVTLELPPAPSDAGPPREQRAIDERAGARPAPARRVRLYGYDVLYAGPLFVHQFSHAWIDFRGIRDRFMREKRCDYFENSRRATEVQREYARRNPHGFAGYDEHCWGLTACDGPSNQLPELANERRRLFGYAARGVPYGPDDGTLGGWAALASLPFAPEIALCAARNMLQRYPEMLSAQRYTSSVNPTLASADRGAWVSAGHFGLDQGIVVMMIENHRTQLIWRLMRDCPYVGTGLRRAGFRGGWL